MAQHLRGAAGRRPGGAAPAGPEFRGAQPVQSARLGVDGPARSGGQRRRHAAAAHRASGAQLPGARSPPGRAEPAVARALRGARARPRVLRLRRRRHGAAGAGEHVPCRGHAGRGHRGAEGDLHPQHRRAVHAHRQPRGAAVAAGTHGSDPEPAGAEPRAPVAHPDQAHRRRDLRGLHPEEVRGRQELLARGRRDADPAARPGHREGGQPGRPRDRAGDGPPRAPQRAGQHPGQEPAHHLPRVRGQGPRDASGSRRRQVPPRLQQRLDHRGGGHDPPVAGVQPVPPGVRRSCGARARAGQAGPGGGQTPREGVAHPGARRRRLHRRGRGPGEPQPVRPGRLPGRRRAPRHRQQPGRLHDRAPPGAHLDLRQRHRQDAAEPDLPRQRRGPGGGGAGDRAGHGLPARVQARRGGRHVLLPPAGAQRVGRALVHAAGHVRQDQAPRQRARRLPGASADARRGVARGSGPDRRGPPRAPRARAVGRPQR